MKKALNYITLFIVAAAFLTACKKDYLDTVPSSSVGPEDIFATTENARTALNGIHRSLYLPGASQDQGGQSKNIIDMEVAGEDLIFPNRGTGWFNVVMNWITPGDENSITTTYIFSFYYDIISNANMILAYIDDAEGPQADKDDIKGQALAYRGWAYYQLIQLYGERYVKGATNDGPGLSIILKPTNEEVPRSPVQKVYEQIITDLDDAIATLDGATVRKNKSNLDKSVALGLRARVALTMQDYTKAIEAADKALQGYNLMSNAQYLSGFNDYTNPEWMWGYHQPEDQNDEQFNTFFAFMSNFNSSHNRGTPKCINAALYNTLSSTDVRKKLWDPTGSNTDFPIPPGGIRAPYMQRKFTARYGSGSSAGDVPLMRVAEMYLIKAEALAKIGGRDTEARQALYQLAKNRDPEYQLSTSSGQGLIQEILTQRRIELWGEGFRFFDLKRQGLPLDRNVVPNIVKSVAVVMEVPADSKLWQWRIPRAELDANRNSVQNP